MRCLLLLCVGHLVFCAWSAPCDTSEYGCCPDGLTKALGLDLEGCPPEDVVNATMTSPTSTMRSTAEPLRESSTTHKFEPVTHGKKSLKSNSTTGNERNETTPTISGAKEDVTHSAVDLLKVIPGTHFNSTDLQRAALVGANGSFEFRPPADCSVSSFGCCPDLSSYASGPNNAGCGDVDEALTNYPRQFKAKQTGQRTRDNSNAFIEVTWLPPNNALAVNAYQLYYTYNLSAPLTQWKSVNTTGNRLILFVRPTMVYFKLRAFIGRKKGVITPTHTLNILENQESRQLIGGCYGTLYGCCDDGLTAAAGFGRQGCPETLPQTTMQTTTAKELPAPASLHVKRDAINFDGVVIRVTWPPPAGIEPPKEYILRVTENVSLARDQWRQVPLIEATWWSTLPHNKINYYTVAAIVDGRESAQSPVYSYNSAEIHSKLYVDACGGNGDGCVTTTETPRNPCGQWGCCSDGTTLATGPDGEGCDGPLPCDLTTFQCCPDGETNAGGDNFKGCGESLPTKTYNPICFEPEERIRCDADYTVRWLYDSEHKSCRKYWYGGCIESGNSFLSQDDCTAACNPFTTVVPVEVNSEGPVCSQTSAITGDCRGSHLRWTFNSSSMQCEQFSYGGCGGTQNRFLTANLCERTCLPQEVEEKEKEDVCVLPLDKGPCDASFSRWFFDNEKRKCEPFTYGGCGGNGNKFHSKQACKDRCDKGDNLHDICLLSSDPGPCDARLPHYSFDFTSGQCTLFSYGGCEGNANRFATAEKCRDACAVRPFNVAGDSSPCFLSPSAGPCSGQLNRWYHDFRTGKCHAFAYGGCRGNQNNFLTEEACKTLCSQEETITTQSTTSACQLPPERGSCGERIVKWFYDSRSHSCQRFLYSGCRGNANRFDHRDACRQACIQEAAPGVVPTTHPSGERPPVIINNDDITYRVNEGSDVTLKCRASGSPVPSYNWYINRVPLEPAGNAKYSLSDINGDLTVKDVESADAGEYICVASNGVGRRAYLYIDLTVEDRQTTPTPPTTQVQTTPTSPATSPTPASRPVRVKGGYDVITTALGNSVRLVCDASGYPPPRVSWSLRDGSKRSEGSVLLISNVRSEDGGDYVCTADNGISRDQKVVTLRITPSLQVALLAHNTTYKEEDRLSLTCQVNSYYLQSLKWRKDGRYISTSSQGPAVISGETLTIDRLTTSDSGNYECLVTNGNQTTFARTQITVQPQTSACQLPPKRGSCGERIIKWFYDSRSEICRRFQYSGCRGNANRFDHIDACRQACVQQVETTTTVPGVVPTTQPSGERPPVIINNDDITYRVNEGSDVTLKCRASGSPAPSYNWYINRVPLEPAGNAKYSLSDINGDLTVKDVESADTGEYICVASNGVGRRAYLYIDLTVEDRQVQTTPTPPTTQVQTTPTSPTTSPTPASRPVRVRGGYDVITTALGNSVRLVCDASGYPPPRVSWSLRDGSKRSEGSVLLISNVRSEDGGDYVCTADNGISRDQKVVTLRITLPPTPSEPVRIKGGDAILTATIGGTIEFFCEATGYPAPRISWSFSKDDRKVADGHILRVYDVRAEDQGDYVCTAENGLTRDEAVITLKVPSPLQVELAKHRTTYMEGETLSLTCLVTSYEPATLKWRKNGREISDSHVKITGETMTIETLTLSDGGFYDCLVSNGKEVTYDRTRITVEAKRTTPTPPKVPCGDRLEYANCRLVVQYGFCSHEVYRHFCCNSCVRAGKISMRDIKPSRYSSKNSLYPTNNAERQ